MNQIEISKKQLLLVIVFLCIYITGTVLIFTVPFSVKSTYGLTTTTTDGVTISFNVFEPIEGGNNKKAVIIGHGSMANKEMMQSYAIELAAAGFVAIPFDFRGHGQSTGERSSGDLTDDIIAIKEYLNTRSDIDIHNLGYIGLSMGGIGQQVINVDNDFKCFIGTATWLYDSLREGNEANPLNVLMIEAKFDEIIDVSLIKEVVADRVGIPEVNVNQLYGNFQEGNATKIYYDDNSNHIFAQWDMDFIREARNWVINTFPDVIQPDENFYGHIRLIILAIQLFGGIGFFFLIIRPVSSILLSNRVSDREVIDIVISENSLKNLLVKGMIYSLLFGIAGILIMLIINMPLGLAIFGFVLSLIFGQAFALLLLLWRLGKKSDIGFSEIFKKPFKIRKENLILQILLGLTLAAVLYLIIYSSLGLNYFGFVPSLTKSAWVPVYYLITVFIFIIYGLFFQTVIQSKFGKGLKSLCKLAMLNFLLVFLYMLVYMLILSLAIRTFYYFGFIVPLTIPVFLITSFIWTFSYQKTGNILVGAFASAFFFTMMISTSAQLQTTLDFILGFIS